MQTNKIYQAHLQAVGAALKELTKRNLAVESISLNRPKPVINLITSRACLQLNGREYLRKNEGGQRISRCQTLLHGCRVEYNQPN